MKLLVKISWFLLLYKPIPLNGGDIKISDRMTLIAEAPDEVLRRQLIAALGDLNQYVFLWIHPERVFQASAISKVETADELWYEISYWPGNVPKESIIKSRLTAVEANQVLDSIVKVFKSAKDPAEEIQDQDFSSGRIFMYEKIQNPERNHWTAVAVRTDSENVDFKKILELTIPKASQPSKSDLDSFFGK